MNDPQLPAAAGDLWKLADATLAGLRSRGLSPDPQSYHIWFMVEARQQPDLLEAVRAAERAGASIDSELIGRLYRRFVEATFAYELLDQNFGGLNSLVNGAEQSLNDAMTGVARYGDALDTASSDLTVDVKPDRLKGMIIHLQAETDLVKDVNQRLHERLEEYKSQILTMQQELEEARREATTDALTGVANRKRFESFLSELVTSDGTDHLPLTLMMVDVDTFKEINDKFGHRVGDQVLQLVASKLENNTKGRDLVARYGGDEFSIILPTTELADAAVLGENLRQRIERLNLRHKASGTSIKDVTISIGLSQWRPGDSPSDLVSRADAALYKAKQSGRNIVLSDDGSEG